jgi:uncharacterized protein (DUF1800 family)
MRRLLYPTWSVAFALGLLSPPALSPARAAEAAGLTAKEKASHVLNRLGYGPRAGEIEAVATLGAENWIRLQLDPAKIPDPAAERAVAQLTKLQIPSTELVAAYQREIRQRTQAQTAKAKAEAETKGAPTTSSATSMNVSEDRLLVAQALGELQHAKLARAVFSERQLEQVLVDFWFNHFNVDARKQQVRATVVGYEQESIRPHVFGNFRDLLGATARSPAMLVYLDNWRSTRTYTTGEIETAMAARIREATVGSTSPGVAPQPEKRGLNENYGRELLELHTLGVDGGYTQNDVQEVARAFTGWTINPRNGTFLFRDLWHDSGPKKIMAVNYASAGVKEGDKILDMLATHPATARHLATKLCQRFVADSPLPDLVERVAQAFLKSKGNLRATYQALFLSPGFFSPQYFGAKTKSPFEFVVSCLRATGASFVAVENWPGHIPLRAVEAGATLGVGGERLANLKHKTTVLHLLDMGQPLYAWGPPTGFPENSSTWISSGALVARLNFALALTGGQVADARINARPLVAGSSPDQPEAVISALARSMLGREPTDSTRKVLLAQAAPSRNSPMSASDLPKLLALLLGSPEFQHR